MTKKGYNMNIMKKFLKENWILFASLVYLLSPIDLLPDFIAGLGLIDDATVVVTSIIIQFYKYFISKKRQS
jgi:uncharacterized membrane protein YkvA (DUF1232 family)